VLEASRDAGVRRVIYAASASAYGNAAALPKVESMPADPRTPYALQKYTGELYCRLYSQLYGLETVALRYFNVYGPRQDPAGDYAAAVPRFISACLSGVAPHLYGDGRQTRDFVFVSDAVRANLLAVDAPEASGAVCNVASGRATSLLDLLDEIRRQTWTAMPAIHEPPREGDVRDSLASLDRARALLGYEPSVDLREGLRLTIEHFEKQAKQGSHP
jgi:UDP-glucose 4-epimerase